MRTSVKRVKSMKALEQSIEDAEVEGWSLKTRGDKLAVMQKSGGVGGLVGHTLIFLTTAWWTFFLGNIFYAAYRYVTERQELRIKVE